MKINNSKSSKLRNRSGKLYGIGLGPGDPDLMTIKAVRIIGFVEVIVYHSAKHGHSIARDIAKFYLSKNQLEEQLIYPVTTDTINHSGGYSCAIAEFYLKSALRIAYHLECGRNVALLTEGDPFFYSSYAHMHVRLLSQFCIVVIPGVTSFSAASASLNAPLVQGKETLTILPGNLPNKELTKFISISDTTIIVKSGKFSSKIHKILKSTKRINGAFYIEKASKTQQLILPVDKMHSGIKVPYFSLIISTKHFHSSTNATNCGKLTIIGLGPGGSDWMTPQTYNELSTVTDLVGYGPYLDRVKNMLSQQKHPSYNTYESSRAHLACKLAKEGRKVAVVSSGDSGIFAMATSVLEEAKQWPNIDVKVVPAMTSAQAVASRVGAPLGHDYGVISLSDRLKPWRVIKDRLVAIAKVDMVLVIYNPSSRMRTWNINTMQKLLLKYRNKNTLVVIAYAVSITKSLQKREIVNIVYLSNLDKVTINMQTMLIIGSSKTQSYNYITSNGVKNNVIFTPRYYYNS